MRYTIVVFKVDGREKPPYAKADVLGSMQLAVEGRNNEEAVSNALETARHFEKGTWVYFSEKL